MSVFSGLIIDCDPVVTIDFFQDCSSATVVKNEEAISAGQTKMKKP